jgi:hypothetical protein
MDGVLMIIPEHFWNKVNKDGPIPEHRPDLGPCWIWTASIDKDGYGKFADKLKIRRTTKAHRVAYAGIVEPIPDGHEIDHLCRNRPCVRPTHLEPVIHHLNLLRSPNTLNSRNRVKIHCPQGHAYTAENTAIGKGGSRKCRICVRRVVREIKRRQSGYYIRHPEEMQVCRSE